MIGPESKIKQKAIDLGFSKTGIARAVPLQDEGERLQRWLGLGFQATMDWMARSREKRQDPRIILPGAKSLVALAMNYYTDTPHQEAGGTGKISRYAWGSDYHDIVSEGLEKLRLWMLAEFPGCEVKGYVDTGPVMEKAWAQRGGVGWQGKHTNVITREFGSWVFLAELITTLDLTPDDPAVDLCGDCTRCIDACPTNAIVGPYVVDSNLCLSYLTIEHRGDFPDTLDLDFRHWIYGCDICQDVCPWNKKFAAPTHEERFAPREGNAAPPLAELEGMSLEEFSRRFKESPIKRTKREGLARNVRTVIRGQSRGKKEP